MSVHTDTITATYLKAHSEEWFAIVDGLEVSSTEICVDCGYRLGGLLGSFQWGIINGQGHCSNCGFPYQLYHRFKVEGREDVVLLAYVPLVSLPLREEGR